MLRRVTRCRVSFPVPIRFISKQEYPKNLPLPSPSETINWKEDLKCRLPVTKPVKRSKLMQMCLFTVKIVFTVVMIGLFGLVFLFLVLFIVVNIGSLASI